MTGRPLASAPSVPTGRSGETAPAQREFQAQLIALLPKLRQWALALCRERAAAEDLVQDAVMQALAGWDSFIPGTNSVAWMHRILRNRFISTVRKRREMQDIDTVPEGRLAIRPLHEVRLAIDELRGAFGRLSPEHRAALVLVVVQEMPYEEAAATVGCAVGTMKSRVHRARQQLQGWLLDAPAEVRSAAMVRLARRHGTDAAAGPQQP